MSEQETARFEDTLDALEAQREQTEARFRELLDGLTASVDAVRSAKEQIEAHSRQHGDARAQALAQLDERVVADAATRLVAWPTGGGVVRRRVNAFARWLLRDYLETIDRRADALNAGIDGREEGIVQLRAITASLADAERDQQMLALLSASHAALEAAAGAHRQMLDLVNAKDAEVLQRAVGGPLRRMELIFDEFGRQQEALLAQLVRRRRELDAE